MLKSSLLLTVILFTVTSNFTFAQNSPEFKKYKLLYPDENQVEIKNNKTIDISLKNGEISVVEKLYSEKIYLNSTVKYQFKESVSFSEFYTIDKLEASSINFVKGKYKTIKVTDFKTKDEIESSSFYDNRKSINFYYQGLVVGSKTKISYNTHIKNPRFLGGFYFGDFHPIENFEFTIIADKNIELGFAEMYTDTAQITFTKTPKGSRIIYKWTKNKIISYSTVGSSVNFRYRIPHIIPHIKYHYTKTDTTFILNSIGDLYSWYQDLTKDINKAPCSTEIKVLVDSLTKDETDNLNKVKNIYNWTQKNIKYIAFEDGLGGFIPRNANDVINKKYGDCKDNSSLLHQMLKEAGIKGHLTWVGTRKLPYQYEKVYTPIVDNHMILTYFDKGTPYFLDATGRYADITIVPSFIQGKEALVALDKDNFKIVKIPVTKNSVNTIKEALEITIDSNNQIIGKGVRKYTGYEKNNVFDRLERVKTDKKLKEYYRAILEKGNNNFLLDDFSEQNKFNYEGAFTINYNFHINNYVNENDGKLYVNLNFTQSDVAAIKNSPPFNSAIDYTHKYQGVYTTTFNIPENYEVEYLPKNFNEKNNLCEISITYELKGNSIYYSHIITTDFLMLPANRQKELNDLLNKTLRSFKEVVVLKTK